MNDTLLSQQVADHGVDLYERIISDLQGQHFSVVDSFFEQAIIKNCKEEILQLYAEDDLKKAAIGNKTNEKIREGIRGDHIKWIDRNKSSAFQKRLLEGIDHFVDYLNSTCFLGIIEKEFHYAVYPKGTFYKRHLDVFQHDLRRRLSMVIYLNEDWQKEHGGELVIYKTANDKEQIFPLYPSLGRTVLFECQVLEHEVMQVKKGLRLSITGWLRTR